MTVLVVAVPTLTPCTVTALLVLAVPPIALAVTAGVAVYLVYLAHHVAALLVVAPVVVWVLFSMMPRVLIPAF